MGRKSKPEKKKVRTLGASVVKTFEDEIIALGAQRERNKAWFSGRLLLRGYIAFLYDGRWEAASVREEAISKGIDQEHMAIIEAQLKGGKDQEERPSLDKPVLIPTGRAYPHIPSIKKGGRK